MNIELSSYELFEIVQTVNNRIHAAYREGVDSVESVVTNSNPDPLELLICITNTVLTLIKTGHKLEAIKELRRLIGCDLKNGKMIIEGFESLANP